MFRAAGAQTPCQFRYWPYSGRVPVINHGGCVTLPRESSPVESEGVHPPCPTLTFG